MRRLMLAALALGFAFSTTVSAAPSCRDGKGKFIKCATVVKAKKCRDAKGKFIACKAA